MGLFSVMRKCANKIATSMSKAGKCVLKGVDIAGDAMVKGIDNLDKPMSLGDKYTPRLMKGADELGEKLEKGIDYISGNRHVTYAVNHYMDQLADDIKNEVCSKRGKYINRKKGKVNGHAISLDGHSPIGDVPQFPNLPVPMYRNIAKKVGEPLFIYNSNNKTFYYAEPNGYLKKDAEVFPARDKEGVYVHPGGPVCTSHRVSEGVKKQKERRKEVKEVKLYVPETLVPSMIDLDIPETDYEIAPSGRSTMEELYKFGKWFESKDFLDYLYLVSCERHIPRVMKWGKFELKKVSAYQESVPVIHDNCEVSAFMRETLANRLDDGFLLLSHMWNRPDKYQTIKENSFKWIYNQARKVYDLAGKLFYPISRRRM